MYSFSEAKRFELELYDEFNGKPVTFDKPGIVELGCNIHDWMLAYIYVTDASYFGVTDASGNALIDAPEGEYEVQIWHPNFDSREQPKPQKIQIKGSSKIAMTLDYPLDQAFDFSSGFSDY